MMIVIIIHANFKDHSFDPLQIATVERGAQF